jgi:histidinol-phosphatase (PHP family)
MSAGRKPVLTFMAQDVTVRAMSLPPDYHMHTPLCRHATGAPSEYAAQALRLGLTEIGFSDHSPMRSDDFDDWRMRLDQLDEYVEAVRRTQRDFPQLHIRLALEMDYLPGHEDWLRELTARYPWDYLIGSVHYVLGDWDVDNPARQAMWKDKKPADVWADYYDRLTKAAASGLFDYIGHADLPKKFGVFPTPGCLPHYERFLRVAGEKQTPIELNTAGLRKDCHEIYPSPAFVRMAFEHGVPITFGSDAHAPGEVGYAFEQAVQTAREAGYTRYCRFAQRKCTEVPL